MALINLRHGSLEMDLPPHSPCPGDISHFLHERDWWQSSDSTGQYFEKQQYTRMTWEQAMAVEFYAFITLGGR